jgi:translation initiation factor 2 alpha subunit (eIF-2alpha)
MQAEPNDKHVWMLVKMAKDDKFHAWVDSMSMYGSLFNLIAKEVGMEKALKMHAAIGAPFGDQIGNTLKEQLAGKKVNIRALNKIIKPMMSGMGYESEVKKSPKSLTIRVTKCPMYEGFKMAGLDHKTIEKMCSAMSQAEYDAINKHIPKLEGRVKFRESPNDVCVEEFIIK